MKLKLLLFLIAGLGISEMAAGTALDKKVEVALTEEQVGSHRSTTSPDFQAFLDASFLSIEQTSSPEPVTFTVTITDVSIDKIAFTAVSGESTYSIDLSKLSLGEYRIEIETESVSLFGSFTL